MRVKRASITTRLDSESILTQARYHRSLQEQRVDKACEFLLQDAQYIKWDKQTDKTKDKKKDKKTKAVRKNSFRTMLITGDMGSGKSVCLSFLVDRFIEDCLFNSSNVLVYHYYCQMGTYMSLLSTLLLQVLQNFPTEEEFILNEYQTEQETEQPPSGRYPEENTHFLERLLAIALGRSNYSTVLMIDGLDVFSRAQRRQTEAYLEQLLTSVPKLRLVLSYRYEHQHSKPADVPTVHLTPCAERDHIIVESLVNENLGYLSLDVRQLVIDRLSPLAKGNARWATTVIHLIERLRISAFSAMGQFLGQIPCPEDLYYTYKEAFRLCTNGEADNRRIAVAALKLLAVSRRQLSMTELAWGVALTFKEHSTTSIASLGDIVDPHRVISLIEPFITHINSSDTKKRQVRLVHESVKDFIFSSISTSLETSISQKKADVEVEMLNVCVNYLLRDEIDEQPLFSDTQNAITELPQEVDLFDDGNDGVKEYTTNCTWEEWEKTMTHYDPAERGFGEFFVYAACHWLDHFSTVSTDSLVDCALVGKLCRAGSTRMSNWIEQSRRPSCAIQPRFEFDPTLYDPLSIAALFASPVVFREMLRHWSFSNMNSNFLPGSIAAAIDQVEKWGDMNDAATRNKLDMLRHPLNTIMYSLSSAL